MNVRTVALTAAGLAGGAAIATATTLGIQRISSGEFATVQQGPTASNWWVGMGGASAAGIGAITWANTGGRTAAAALPLLGAAVGAFTGAYLVAPAIRRWSAEH
jgi:hypothetical protein